MPVTRLALYGGIAQPYGFQQGDGPNPFVFPAAQGVALSTVGVESVEITISGVVDGSAITVSGDAGYGYSLNGGAFVTTAGAVNNDDTLKVRVDAAATYNTGTSVTVTINELVVTFVVVTLKDPNPAVVERAPITHLHVRR